MLIRPSTGGVIARPLIMLIPLNLILYSFGCLYAGWNMSQISNPNIKNAVASYEDRDRFAFYPIDREQGAIFVHFGCDDLRMVQ